MDESETQFTHVTVYVTGASQIVQQLPQPISEESVRWENRGLNFSYTRCGEMLTVFAVNGFRKLRIYMYTVGSPENGPREEPQSVSATLTLAGRVDNVARWIEHACSSVIEFCPWNLSGMPAVESVMEIIECRIQAAESVGGSPEDAERIAYLAGIGEVLSRHPDLADATYSWGAWTVCEGHCCGKRVAHDFPLKAAVLSLHRAGPRDMGMLGIKNEDDDAYSPILRIPPMYH